MTGRSERKTNSIRAAAQQIESGRPFMAVQFILGRSGTGKTSCSIRAIVKALQEGGDQPLILLVPEQASYQAERAILSDESIAGYNRLNVLSFDRLQFLLLGKNTARPALTRLGRQMIVHKLLRANSGKLKVFGSLANSTGMARQVAETISELHRYAKTPDDIDRLLTGLSQDRAGSLTALKFADIGLILLEYLKSIEGKFTDPDIELGRACGAIAAARFIRKARLWVDGFAAFTTTELVILAELLKTVADARIAICLDPAKLDLKNPDRGGREQFGLFSTTGQTYAALLEIIRKHRLELAEPIVLNEPIRFSRCRQLAHIERGVFEPDAPKIAVADNIRIVSAPNARAEVRFAASQISQLVRENNCRYRDIAVIASTIDRYQHYIKAYFDDYGIPFFIDRRKALNQHPVVHLICSALQAVIGGFSHYDIFSYLKSDLVPVPRDDIDLLENYCLAYGVSGADWQADADWHFAAKDDLDFDEARINRVRRELIAPLLRLKDLPDPSDGQPGMIRPRRFTQVVFEFLDGIRVRQTLGKWIEQAREAGDYPAADEHRQFYDKLVAVFDEIVEVFADEQMTCEDYLALLNSAFSQLTLAFIPPNLDQVLVGSVERSRHPDLKTVFLIGATQRQFPTPVTAPGILTDDDRDIAASADFTLAPNTRQRLAERQYLAYIAFTRPSQSLFVTYPLIDEKGSPECRSQFVGNLESLFEGLKEESIAGEQIAIENIRSEKELADLLCNRLGKNASGDSARASCDRLEALLDELCSDEELADVGSKVVAAITYDNRAALDCNSVERLFGRRLNSSATKLGTFAACPYQYFARFILDLRQRREFKFEPLDVGVFYHRILDGLLRRLNAEKKDFATIDDQRLLKLLREQIVELVQADSFISNFAGRGAHNAFIIDSAGEVLEDCVLAIAQMVRAGSFRPCRSETAFGAVKGTTDTIGEYGIPLSDNRLLFLAGKIDRLDVAGVDGRKVAIVFDYKRRGKSFSWSHFYYGLDMQLPIYMLALRNASDAPKEVVGGFYMPVEAGPGRSTLDELSSKEETFDYKAKGIFNGEFAECLDNTAQAGWSRFYSFRITAKDRQYGNYRISAALRPEDFDKVLKFGESRTVELAEGILSGKIEIKPYRLSTESPCGYCDYRSVCRFDWQINDYNFLETMNKIEVLERIAGP